MQKFALCKDPLWLLTAPIARAGPMATAVCITLTVSPAVTKCHEVSFMVRPGPAISNALHTQKVNLLLLG